MTLTQRHVFTVDAAKRYAAIDALYASGIDCEIIVADKHCLLAVAAVDTSAARTTLQPYLQTGCVAWIKRALGVQP